MDRGGGSSSFTNRVGGFWFQASGLCGCVSEESIKRGL